MPGRSGISQPQMAQELDEQPAGIAAGTRTLDQRFFRRLHAGFEPDQVLDVPRQLPVEVHEKIIAALLLTRNAAEITLEERCQRLPLEIRRQLIPLPGLVLEGEILSVRFEKKIERIDDRHFGDEVDLDAKFIGRFEENQTRLIVCLGVLLPIDEVLLGSDPERVA